MKFSAKLLNGGPYLDDRAIPIDYGPKVAVIGDASVYSLWMIKEMVGSDVRVTDYLTNPASNSQTTNLADSDLESRVLGENINRRLFDDNRSLALQMQESDADYFVIASYGNLISNEIVDTYQGRLMNIHPSRLPEYAGVGDPIEQMMQAGRTDGCVTIHWVDEKLDHGPIIGQRDFQLKYDNVNDKARALLYLQTVIPESVILFKEVLSGLPQEKQKLLRAI